MHSHTLVSRVLQTTTSVTIPNPEAKNFNQIPAMSLIDSVAGRHNKTANMYR